MSIGENRLTDCKRCVTIGANTGGRQGNMQPYDPTMLELESMLMQLESNPELMQKLKDFRVKQAEKVLADDKVLRESGYTALI